MSVWRTLGLILMFLAFPLPAFSQQEDAALLKNKINQVEVKREESKEWTEAVKESSLFDNDTLRTLKESRAEVQFSDLSITRLAPLTHLEINLKDRSVRLDIGKIFLRVFKGAKPMNVITPAAVAATISSLDTSPRIAALNLSGIYLVQTAESPGGTELIVTVNENRETEFQVLSGEIYAVTATFEGPLNQGQRLEIGSDGSTAGPQVLNVVEARKSNQDIVNELGSGPAVHTPAAQSQPRDQGTATDQGAAAASEVVPPPPVEPAPTSSPVNLNIF